MLSRCEALLILNALQKDLSFAEVQKLIQTFGSVEAIFAQSQSALKQQLNSRKASLLKNWPEKFDLNQELKLIQKKNVSIIDYTHELYPLALSHIPDPPLLLYCQGTLKKEDQRAIGIVGSRRATVYGTKTTVTLAQQLGHKGWTVISGLAWGIDTHAHKGALQAQARTLAVIGQGLNTPLFPPDNDALAEQIKANGAIISEFPMNFAPVPRNFPQRNRIVSGMSQAVLVVEAARKSGAFITADFALEQGKPVLAVPGPIDSKVSEGPNLLIQQGAKCVLNVADILEELPDPLFSHINEDKRSLNTPPSLSEQEKKVWNQLSNKEIQLEQLIETSGLNILEANQALFTLEIKNLVKHLPGQYYVRL